MNTKIKSTRMITMVPLLSAIAFALAFFEASVPLTPPFMKMDISDLPALIGSFALGPYAGVLIELIKNGLGLFSSSTVGVGELANFLINGSFVFVAGIIYQKNRTRKGAIISCGVAVIVRAVVAVFANYFILFNIYEQFMPMDELIASFSKFIPFIHTKLDVILYSVFPFNLVKGIVNCIMALVVYKRVSPVIKGNSE